MQFSGPVRRCGVPARLRDFMPLSLRTLALASLSSIAASVLFACGTSPGDVVTQTAKTRDPIIHGIDSDASQDAVLLVEHDGGAAGIDTCTGTLIAPNLVLTARHCVSTTGDAGFSCGADGVGSVEGAVGADFPVVSLKVFIGVRAPSPSAKPAGVAAKIFHDSATNLCNHDLALILLKAPIAGALVASIRLESDVKVGEKFTAIGWGETDKTFDPTVRQQRTGIPVVFSGIDKINDVPSNQFNVGESICSGDSGGPAISEVTGAIIGIVSSGAGPNPYDPSKPGNDCIDGDNDYTKIAPFKDTIMAAFGESGYAPVVEGATPPADTGPTTDTGATGDDATAAADTADTGVITTTPGTPENKGSGCSITTRSSSPEQGSPEQGSPEGVVFGLGAALVAGALVTRRRR